MAELRVLHLPTERKAGRPGKAESRRPAFLMSSGGTVEAWTSRKTYKDETGFLTQ